MPPAALRSSPAALRITRWKIEPGYAHVTLPVHPRARPTAEGLAHHVDQLRARGFSGVVTAAVPPPVEDLFHDIGFTTIRRLHLLRHTLDALPDPGPAAVRRVGRAGRDPVLDVDRAAFSPFWRLDRAGLDDAVAATPASRLRVVTGPGGHVAGYALCGRAGSHGYVQRLAVRPDDEGRGYGRALLADGLRWVARRAGYAWVNTQDDNERSLRLYLAAGFAVQPSGLAVLRIDFPEAAVPARPGGPTDRCLSPTTP